LGMGVDYWKNKANCNVCGLLGIWVAYWKLGFLTVMSVLYWHVCGWLWLTGKCCGLLGIGNGDFLQVMGVPYWQWAWIIGNGCSSLGMCLPKCGLLWMVVAYWEWCGSLGRVCLTKNGCGLLAMDVTYWECGCLTGNRCDLLAIGVIY
jgi:hypothetical protein